MSWQQMVEQAEQSASAQVHRALVQKGYRVLAQHAARTNRQLVFTLYSKGPQVLLMQTRSGTDEQLCELYRPVCDSTSIADTITAIP